MAAVAALVDSPASAQALRRALPRDTLPTVACRSPRQLSALFGRRLLDAVVLSPSRLPRDAMATLRADYPSVPLIALAGFRPDDATLLLECHAAGCATAVVAGVDDAVLAEIIGRHTLTAARRDALRDAPRVLRLADRLQLDVWELILREVQRPLRTADIARRLKVSREHLSRQFGAGGAPTLKRVIDLVRVAAAAQLVASPGYTSATVARLLAFTSTSHLGTTARRIAGLGLPALGKAGPRGVLAGFVKLGHRA